MQWADCDSVERDPHKMIGAWVFADTRVPLTALFESREAGATMDEFVDWFPRVTRERASAVLQHPARSQLAAP